MGHNSAGTVQSCYSTGTVSGTSSNKGGVVGYNRAGTVTGCYYDNTGYTDNAIGTDTGTATDVLGKTTEQFASGEVAYLLQSEQTEQVWGQNIGTDAYPVLGGAQVYYGYISNEHSAVKVYTNDANATAENDHTGGTATCKELAKCEHCGASYGELADHTGGTATCKTQAVCEVCGASYGELDPNNHEYEKNNGICCDTYQSATLNADGYYEIFNAGQLFWFANHINTVDRTASAVLAADIDLEGRPWTPIGSTGESSNNFRGVFDGQNHTIEGLYVEGGRAGLGFFGEVRTGTVKNFTIYGEVVVNTEVDYVGGVIGSACGLNSTDHGLERNGAIIQNITSYVNLTAKVHGTGKIGGFVGYANHESLIENCSWYGTFDAGIYRVDNGAGGFIGRIQENTSEVTIRNCAAYGTIKTNYAGDYNNTATIYMGGFLSFSNTNAQTTLENCLFAGKFERGENLTDEARLGAFGTLRGVKSIKNCYYLGDDGLEVVHSDSPLKTGENIEITSVTGAQLLSGEVAYKLGEAFGQTLAGENRQNYPVLGGAKVYQVTNCKGETAYSNTEENSIHTEQTVTGKVPTCTEPGLTDGVICSVCGETLTAQDEIPAGHKLTQVEAQAPTCTEAGWEAYEYCTECDYTTKVEIPAGHSWLDATCTTPKTCSVCGATEGEALGHSFGDDNTCTNADCTARRVSLKVVDKLTGETVAGVTVRLCESSGGTSITKDEWTSTTEAYVITDLDVNTTYTLHVVAVPEGYCLSGYAIFRIDENNNISYSDEITWDGTLLVKVRSHTEEIVPGYDATCTEPGLTDGVKCADCGETITAQGEIPAPGHKLTQVEAQAPTCTEAGWEAYEYCTECGYTTKVEIPADGHGEAITYTSNGDTHSGTYDCCGEAYVTDEAHTYHALTHLCVCGAETVAKNGIYAEDGSLFYYVDGVRTYAGLIEIDGDYYYVRTSGEVVHGRSYWITKTNDLLPAASYYFGETGKLGDKNGFFEEDGGIYYYVDGERNYAGLIYVAGNYYYIRTSGEVVTNRTYYITKTNGLLPAANYYFDEEGKMQPPRDTVKSGIYEEGDVLFYYENGEHVYGGLMLYSGDLHKADGTVVAGAYDNAYIYVRTSGEVVAGRGYWISKTNDLLDVAYYQFDENGIMVNPPA